MIFSHFHPHRTRTSIFTRAAPAPALYPHPHNLNLENHILICFAKNAQILTWPVNFYTLLGCQFLNRDRIKNPAMKKLESLPLPPIIACTARGWTSQPAFVQRNRHFSFSLLSPPSFFFFAQIKQFSQIISISDYMSCLCRWLIGCLMSWLSFFYIFHRETAT